MPTVHVEIRRPGHHHHRHHTIEPSSFIRQIKPNTKDANHQNPSSEHSRYVQMLLQQDDIPLLHNILASVFVWLLLAGFLVFPGTFTSLQASVDKQGDGDNDHTFSKEAAKLIVKSIKNIPLLVIAIVMCCISAIGMLVLTMLHAKNYVWIVNKLFLPGMTNSLAGLVSTLIGVYSQQHGTWSITARTTAITEGASLAVCGGLFLFCRMLLLRKVKETHEEHYKGWPGHRYSKQLFPDSPP
ncbi:uncharacterized protein TRIREDRAFT_110651 [Trichoderma reesei QM6a]|jgi:hypothetical protein|uniref:Predicted protein n=1 Tax=Hypocrea jecorina (strain QM6a) TaxID=431241 RepID=G0RSK4_HYPJQ|nr:uncharacterized protein TRIREDRAFT_110651 [Trichoderma reesei QM6a]EGR45850.1 predicted protein [Trichoderma reesei QM6a]